MVPFRCITQNSMHWCPLRLRRVCLGSEALFVLVTAAKEFVERCIEQDSQAALRALEKIDAANDGPIMKRVSHDPDLVQVCALSTRGIAGQLRDRASRTVFGMGRSAKRRGPNYSRHNEDLCRSGSGKAQDIPFHLRSDTRPNASAFAIVQSERWCRMLRSATAHVCRAVSVCGVSGATRSEDLRKGGLLRVVPDPPPPLHPPIGSSSSVALCQTLLARYLRCFICASAGKSYFVFAGGEWERNLTPLPVRIQNAQS